MNGVCRLQRGCTPVLVSIPHAGTRLADGMKKRMTRSALTLADTDWHLPRLYSFLNDLGVSVLQAEYSRYVVDLNRYCDGRSLYPGQSVTEICPTTDFDNRQIYRDADTLTPVQVAARIERYWVPWHRLLQHELKRIKERFGFALLWDAHSIRSQVPRFFEGQLPDLNFGSVDGCSCDPALTRLLCEQAERSNYSWVLNGRFKGGAITHLYGEPAAGVHAVQLELSQITYMNETSRTFCNEKANQIRPVLTRLIKTLLAWQPDTSQ